MSGGFARTSIARESAYTVLTGVASDEEWDGFVRADVPGTFCHLAGWRHVMADGLDNEPIYLSAVDDEGTLAGLLPLVHVRSRLFGRFMVSMPFLNYGGALGEPGARHRLVEEALAIARRRGATLLVLRTRHHGEPLLREEHRRVTVLLSLPDTGDELRQRFPSKLRSQIRRPMKAGMTASFGNEQLPEFYAVFARTMRDLGTPVLPRRFFDHVVRQFGERTMIGVVRTAAGQPLAAGFGFEWGGEVEITWAGALREHSVDAPNMLLYWAFMEESIRRRAHTFNFGRCRPGGGTHRFKLQWGGHDVPLPWSVWSERSAHAPSPDNGGYGLAVRAWQRLPLPVANTLGPLLARRLP
jgi:serine/alanine adding enzyme